MSFTCFCFLCPYLFHFIFPWYDFLVIPSSPSFTHTPSSNPPTPTCAPSLPLSPFLSTFFIIFLFPFSLLMLFLVYILFFFVFSTVDIDYISDYKKMGNSNMKGNQDTITLSLLHEIDDAADGRSRWWWRWQAIPRWPRGWRFRRRRSPWPGVTVSVA